MNNNGKITAPVNTDDVSSVLGVGSHDVATLCSAKDKINPASKCKPIRYDKPESLSDNERIGSQNDQLSGIFYGLRISTLAHLYDVHDANYEYLYVRAGTDWARLDDFVGYDHLAQFNPTGSIDTHAQKETGGPVYINYNTSPSGTGVDIAALIPLLTADANFTLAKCYPCVLVTLGTKRYARALWCQKYNYTTNANNGFCQMYNEGWQNRWLIILNDLPNVKAGDNLTVSVFFMQYISGSMTANKDFRSWQEVTSTLQNSQRVFTCPEAVAKNMTVTSAHPKALAVTLVSLSSKNATGSASFSRFTDDANKPNNGVQYRISLAIRPKSGSSATITAAHIVVGSSMTQDTGVFSFNTNLAQVPSGAQYTCTWSVTEVNSNINVNSGSLDVMVL